MLFAIAENIPLFMGLLVATYVLAAVCAVREVVASRTSQGSIAWLVALAFLPFPTAFIYLVFGWKAFDSYAQTRLKDRHARLLRGKNWP